MPWELFKFERKPPDISLKDKISIRQGREIAIARDLVEKHIGDARIEILMNFEAGEIALRPGQIGHNIRSRKGSKASFVFDAKAFLKAYPIKPGHYPVNWDGEKFIVKVWEPKLVPKTPEPRKPEVRISPTHPMAPQVLRESGDGSLRAPELIAPELMAEEKSSSSEDGATCPVCQKGILRNGACSECHWDEAEGIECPKGLVRPFEKVEVCKGCPDYKRVYGGNPRRCKWNGWVGQEWDEKHE